MMFEFVIVLCLLVGNGYSQMYVEWCEENDWTLYRNCLNTINWTPQRLQNSSTIIDDICYPEKDSAKTNSEANGTTLVTCISKIDPVCYFTHDMDSYLNTSLLIYVNATCKLNYLHERVSALLDAWVYFRTIPWFNITFQRPWMFTACNNFQGVITRAIEIINHADMTLNITRFTAPVLYNMIKSDPRLPDYCDVPSWVFERYPLPEVIPLQGVGWYKPKPQEYRCRKEWKKQFECAYPRSFHPGNKCSTYHADCSKEVSKICTYKKSFSAAKQYLIDHYKMQSINESYIGHRLDLLQQCFANITENDVKHCEFGWNHYCKDYRCLAYVMRDKCFETPDQIIRNSIIPAFRMDCDEHLVPCSFFQQGIPIKVNKTEECPQNVQNTTEIVSIECPITTTTSVPTESPTTITTTPTTDNQVIRKRGPLCHIYGLIKIFAPLTYKILNLSC